MNFVDISTRTQLNCPSVESTDLMWYPWQISQVTTQLNCPSVESTDLIWYPWLMSAERAIALIVALITISKWRIAWIGNHRQWVFQFDVGFARSHYCAWSTLPSVLAHGVSEWVYWINSNVIAIISHDLLNHSIRQQMWSLAYWSNSNFADSAINVNV